MCRFLDTGNYTYDNVYIDTNSKNCSDGIKWNPTKKRLNGYLPPIDKVVGYYFSDGRYIAQFRNKNCGSYNTPEEARNSYLNARNLDEVANS